MSASKGTLSAIVTLLTGLVIGQIGFLRFAQQTASANTDLTLELAGRGHDVSVTAPVALTMLSPIVFALATPTGWLASYLLVTGLVRSLAAAAGERRGDPLAALLRWSVRRAQERRAGRAGARELFAAAGPEVADRLAPAARFGLGPAELVVVASRPKPEWTPGTILDCGGRWLRVGDAVERTLPQGLRTLYPLVETPELEVFRRVVRYDLPDRRDET